MAKTPAQPTADANSDARRVAARTNGAVSLSDRLAHGFLRPREVWELAGRGRSQFYRDVQAGKVTLHKIGPRAAGVRGPDAVAYINAPLAAE
jgi:hypothetical protein